MYLHTNYTLNPLHNKYTVVYDIFVHTTLSMISIYVYTMLLIISICILPSKWCLPMCILYIYLRSLLFIRTYCDLYGQNWFYCMGPTGQNGTHIQTGSFACCVNIYALHRSGRSTFTSLTITRRSLRRKGRRRLQCDQIWQNLPLRQNL